jgi:RHH-type transcriptional regulator, rel operon repressor / antitoxin RelB
MRKPLSIRLDSTLEKRLERLSRETGRSVSFHANLAIREYLDDRQDYVLGIAALERNEPRISLEDLERDLGLDRSGSILEAN